MSYRLWRESFNAKSVEIKDGEAAYLSELVPFFLLALQFGLQPTLNSWFIPIGASNSAMIVVTETVKICLSLGMIWISTTREMREKVVDSLSLRESVFRAGIPAFLYSIQNWLILFGSRHTSPLTLSLLNQTKTLSAAFFAYVLIGKRQTNMQLVALAGLFLGASMIILAERAGDVRAGDKDASSNMIGIFAIGLASLLSGVSSAATELVLARAAAFEAPKEISSLLFSIELASLGILTLLGSALIGINPDTTLLTNPLKNWSLSTLIPVVSNASGGILVGLVTQRAGGVKKGVSLILGICFATLIEGMLGKRALTVQHVIAVVLVLLSMYLYFTNPTMRKEKQS